MRVEGFPWKQFPPEITSDHTVGDVVQAVLIPVAQKTRGVDGTKSMRSAPAVKARLEQARRHSGENAIEHHAAVVDPLLREPGCIPRRNRIVLLTSFPQDLSKVFPLNLP